MIARQGHFIKRLDHPAEPDCLSAYARTALAFADASLDLTLIDRALPGAYSAKFTPSKIKPDRMPIIDNLNCFLPAQSRVLNSVAAPLGPMR